MRSLSRMGTVAAIAFILGDADAVCILARLQDESCPDNTLGRGNRTDLGKNRWVCKSGYAAGEIRP